MFIFLIDNLKHMPSFNSPLNLEFNITSLFVVENHLQVVLDVKDIDFGPKEIIPLNVYTVEHSRSMALARPGTDMLWMVLVTADADGTNRKQHVLQARADSFLKKVSDKRDGGVGLGSWMYSKMHPTRIPVPAPTRFPTAPPVLPAAIQRLATSVADNYFTQPNGKTRQDVLDSLGVFHMGLETLGQKPKRGRVVPEGMSEDLDEDEETSDETGPSEGTPVRVESVGGANSASPAVVMGTASPPVRRNLERYVNASWRIPPGSAPVPAQQTRTGSANPKYQRVGDSLVMRQ